MKKFIKGFLSLVLILLLVGAMVIGFVVIKDGKEGLAASFGKVFNNSNTEKVSGWISEFKNDSIEAGNKVGNEINNTDYDIEVNISFDGNYDILSGDVAKQVIADKSEVVNLDVEVGGCGITFKESADEKFYIEAKNADKLQCYCRNGNLFVKSMSGSSNWDELSGCKVYLYIPEDFTFDSTLISLGAGSVKIDEFRSGTIRTEIGAGSLTIDELICDSADMNIGAGSIDLDNFRMHYLLVEVGIGSFKGVGTTKGDMELNCSMGSLKLKLKDDFEDYNYDVECALGAVKIENEQFVGLVHDEYVDNGADKTINVNCSMGAVNIDF